MNNFISLKSNCPICSGTRRKQDCRENTQTGLIHCLHDVIGTPPGFKFVGVDKIGFNMWAADDGRERDSFEWETQRRQRAAEQERLLAENRSRYAQGLSADERDRNIRRIHAQIGLSTRHRQLLRDRGLTDAQIDAGKYFSIAPWQEVTGINSRLAGVDLDGRKLLIGQSGYACPVWDVQGRIIGYQVRFDDASNGGKYKWATSRSSKRPNGGTAHLPNGELPITCCRPTDGVKLTSIGLAEGFLKSHITAQRQGQVVIGAAGGNFAGSPIQLKANLDALATELDTKTVDLYPDAGAIANNAVMRHYEQAIQIIAEWGYIPRIAWWGQLTKEQPDIDELDSFEQIAYLSPEEFLQLGLRSGALGHSFAGIVAKVKGWFEKQRRSSWGFGRKGEVEVEPSPATTETTQYDPGERLNVWQAPNHLGYRHILDTSATGTGKSYDTGLLTPEMFDVRQIIYISREHHNPTTPTLKEGWHDLPPRHNGQYRDEFGRLRRVNKQQPYAVPPNCGRNETIRALRAKNIPGADTAELVCTTCAHFEPCRANKVFGFLGQRAEALKQERLRAHPDSLPSPEEYDYNHVVLVWDEAAESLKAHRSIEVKTSDVDRAIAILLRKLPQASDALRPLLTSLHQHISGEIKQPNKYGWGDAQIRTELPQVGEIDLDAVKSVLRPDARPILDHTQEEHGVSAADLPRQVRKIVTPADEFTAKKIASELALDWLPDFLDVLLGNQIGSLRIQYGTLTVTLGDDRLAKIANAAACNIYLDATASPEDIMRPLKLSDEKQLFVTQQIIEDTNNLEVIQVTSLGRLGLAQRSEYCTDRVNAVVAEIQKQASGDAAVLDFKKHTTSDDDKRHWWVDSRGINDLETCQTLILTGTPCRNLSELEAEFTILHGRAPKEGKEQVRYPVQLNEQSADSQPYFELEVSVDPQFREFVRRSILATFRQAIGRLRSHRRPGESLKVYIIADYPLDFPVTQIKASDITPEAATKVERREMAIKQIVADIKAKGEKVTQAAIAAALGVTQGYISRFRKLLQTLLDDSYSKSNNSADPPPDPGEIEWNGQEYLPLLAEESTEEVLKGMLTTFEAHGQAAFKAIWDATPAATQVKILKTLLLVLPAGELKCLEECF